MENKIKMLAECKLERLKFNGKKYAPEILLVAGVIGIIGAGVTACVKTTKASDIMKDAENEISAIKDCKQRANNNELTEIYTEEDYKKDITIAYTHMGINFAKLYAPSVLLAGVSIAAIFVSHDMMKKRYLAMSAACTVANKALAEYRGRVIERFGEEVDKELRYDIKAVEIEETEVDGKGKEKTVKKMYEVNGEYYSEYAFVFGECCNLWKPDAEMNLYQLRIAEKYFNDLLNIRCSDGKVGRIFYNEIREYFGLDPVQAGQVMGIEKKNMDDPTRVDLGLYNIEHEGVRRFINGIEPNFIIDINKGMLDNIYKNME